MRTINYEDRWTKTEVANQIAECIRNFGPNQSVNPAFSYRRNGAGCGTGDGTVAISWCLPVYRKGVAYYKQIPFAS